MATVLLTIDMITREALRLWRNSNALLMGVDTQYDDQYAREGAKIGDTLRIRLPNDYTVRVGATAQPQDTNEKSTTLTLATQAGVDVSFSSKDRTLKLSDYSKRIMAPCINNLTGYVAADLMSGADGGISNAVANTDGSNNVITPTATTYLLAGATLNRMSSPKMGRQVINDPFTEARVVAGLSGLFNPQSQIGRQYSEGTMYKALGFEWMMDQTVIKHTNGTAAAGVNTVNGANQSGQTIVVTATTGTMAKGDIITFALVNSVNRITKVSNGALAQFCLTAAVPAGSTSISIYPALIAPVTVGVPVQYQTVDVAPADGAFVNPFGKASETTIKNFAFVPEAITMVTADMELPTKGVIEAHREQFNGVSLRMITFYAGMTDQWVTRLDVLYGYLWIRPEWACIVSDAV